MSSIDLLVSKSSKIIAKLPTDEKMSKEYTKSYVSLQEKLRKQHKYVSPTYVKRKKDPTYIVCITVAR